MLGYGPNELRGIQTWGRLHVPVLKSTDHERSLFFAFVEDITDRKAVEEMLCSLFSSSLPLQELRSNCASRVFLRAQGAPISPYAALSREPGLKLFAQCFSNAFKVACACHM